MNVILWCTISAVTCSWLAVNHHVHADATGSSAIATKCHREDSKKCIIFKLFTLDALQEVILPPLNGKITLQIKQGNLSYFTEKLTNQLGTVEKLQLGPLQLNSIFLIPNLVELSASGNQIDSVEYQNGVDNFKLQFLDLSGNKLNKLHGFNRLLNLRELNLKGNALDNIELSIFKGMTKLEKLSLDRNHIHTVTANEILQLPVLEYFSLSGNQISYLNISNWKLESLTKWDVSSNTLVKIDGKLDEQFLSLQMISLAKNVWQCKWLEGLLQQLNESVVMVQDRDEDCQGISPANICCVPEVDNDLTDDAKLNQLKQLEIDQKDFQSRFEDRFVNMKENNENQLDTIESRLKSIDELINNKLSGETDTNNKNPLISQFESFEKAIPGIHSTLEKEKQLWAKQQKTTDMKQRRLEYAIVELKHSVERDTKQISELQTQFESLRDMVRDVLASRDTLINP